MRATLPYREFRWEKTAVLELFDGQEPRPPAGRLKAGPAPELVQSANRLEVSNAPELLEGMSLADMAHVIVLMETGIVPWRSGQALLAALLEAHNIPAADFPLDPAWGDLYRNRERHIERQAPDSGGWLRAGRARREVTNIGYRHAVRWRLLDLVEYLGRLAETLVARAEEQAETLMPDYTYLQQAQPTTLGHYLLGFVYPMLRDAERLQACFRRINLCPGGIASVNGSRLPLDRERLADLLGFDGPIHHARDAMWQADTPIEVTTAAVALLINLDRLAEDLQVWSTREFNLVELDDGYARASVIMPQKKNPYSLTYVRGLTSVTIGQLVGMANVGRTPSGQPDNRIFAYGEVPRVLEQSREAVQLMTGVMASLQVNAAMMARRSGLGYAQATDVADAIMLATGLPYQRAHQVVGQLVASAVEAGVPTEAVTAEMVDEAAKAVVGYRLNLAPEVLAEALDPRAIVGTRTGLGGAALEPMAAMLAECQEALNRLRSWREAREGQLLRAEEGLLALAGSRAGVSSGGGRSGGALDRQQGGDEAAVYAGEGLRRVCEV
jgi:argininosuccinate lyase